MGTKNDKIILNLKLEIANKKAKLAKVGKFKPVTNCNLELDGSRVNLHVANKEVLLLSIAKINSFKNSLKEVMPEQVLTIGGFSADEWIGDLVSKFDNVNISEEQRRLQLLENKLHELLSTDTKIEIELNDLKSQI